MATYLDNLKLAEVSLVDNPANQHAKVTLFKRYDPNDPNCKPGEDDDEKKVQRKRLSRLTAIQEQADLLAKDIEKLVAPSRLEALQQQVNQIAAEAAKI